MTLAKTTETGTPTLPIETHPWQPFIPQGAKVLILGTFPPGSHRWAMDFYYPNPTNDFWPMMGLIFMNDRNALRNGSGRGYNLQEIKLLLTKHKIALCDSAHRVRRLKGNASDKFLEIVEPVDLASLLSEMPECRDIVTTGEKAAGVIASLTGTEVPRMGTCITGPDGLRIWRMPSTSRAYPMALASKAAHYATMFRQAGVL